MPLSRRVYIIGFMGSGKSTAGKALSKKLGWDFADLDNVIESAEGMKVRDLFAIKGETYFREKEAFCLRSLNSRTDLVISCGGGTPCFHENMDYMINDGLAVYLKMSSAALASRLVSDRGQRPLISGVSPENLPSFIDEKLQYREKFYNRAQITADGLRPCIESLAEMIRKLFGD